MVMRKRICGGIVIWAGLSVEWLLWLYCVCRNDHVWLLFHDVRTLFRDCERSEIVQSLLPIVVLFGLSIWMTVRKRAIYINIRITFLKNTRQLRLCGLELLHKHILGGGINCIGSCMCFLWLFYRSIS